MLDTCKCKPRLPLCPHVSGQSCDLESGAFVQAVAKGVFAEEALRDAARQFKQQPKKPRAPCLTGRVAALEILKIVRNLLHCKPAGGLSVSSYEALQLPTSPIPFCFTNFGQVALVAEVCLNLTGAPANVQLIEISKVTCVTHPIQSCLLLHPKQMVPFLLQSSNCR